MDASFHFPVVETAPTKPAQVSFLPVSRPPLFESSTENEKLSEHYAEFNDLFNEAANVRFVFFNRNSFQVDRL